LAQARPLPVTSGIACLALAVFIPRDASPGAVAQRPTLVGTPALMRLRADDACGWAGAIDHDGRGGGGHDVVHSASTSSAPGTLMPRMDTRENRRRPRVEHHHVSMVRIMAFNSSR